MKPLRTDGFHHITMVSTDAPRTLAFYGELLGLDLVKKTVNFDDPGAYHLYFGRDGGRPGTILTFFEWAHARRGHWGVGGVHHLALGVATPEAQLKWKRRLMDAGVAVSGPIDRGYFKSLYFEDPDGQILEIATAGPGYAIDEPADALGQTLVVPPKDRLAGRTRRSRDRAPDPSGARAGRDGGHAPRRHPSHHGNHRRPRARGRLLRGGPRAAHRQEDVQPGRREDQALLLGALRRRRRRRRTPPSRSSAGRARATSRGPAPGRRTTSRSAPRAGSSKPPGATTCLRSAPT